VLPTSWATALSGLGVTQISGVITHLPIAASGATPSALDIAALSPFASLNVLEDGPGLPIVPTSIGDGGPFTLDAPAVTSAATDTTVSPPVTYDLAGSSLGAASVGPFSATGAAGTDAALSVATTPGYEETGGVISTLPGQGIQVLIDGYAGNVSGSTSVIGPLPIDCNAAAGPPVATVPIVAAATRQVPSITRVAPSSGRAFTLVTITGSHLGGARSVQFGAGHRAFFQQLSSRLIVAVAPPRVRPGKVDMTVTARDGTTATSPADGFTYR